MSPEQEFVVIARILRPQGRRGEVLAEILTDFPEKFSERNQLWLSKNPSDRREYVLEDHWLHKGHVVLKFSGVDSINDAEILAGMLVQIPRHARSVLEPGAVYVSDLIGTTVIDVSSGQRRILGAIEDVQQGIGAAPLLLVRGEKREFEIPFAEAYVVHFDAAGKLLEMNLPSGLLEVNAPLCQEEKREQHRE